MSQLDIQVLRLHYKQEEGTFDPLERRLVHEHLLVAELCEQHEGIHYKLPNAAELPPRDYRITFTGLDSIVAIDEDKLPIYGDTHVLEIHLPTGFPVAPPICYMVTATWHPNIQSDEGPYQGRICGNTEGFGAYYSLDKLIMRIRDMLSYEMYHARLRFPYPEDETVAQWVREYGEPLGIVRPGLGLNREKSIPANWRKLIRREKRMKIKINEM
ncbi:MAG: ubiquitin-conjugating enzyme E2 [Bacteroidota bacterium]